RPPLSSFKIRLLCVNLRFYWFASLTISSYYYMDKNTVNLGQFFKLTGNVIVFQLSVVPICRNFRAWANLRLIARGGGQTASCLSFIIHVTFRFRCSKNDIYSLIPRFLFFFILHLTHRPLTLNPSPP